MVEKILGGGGGGGGVGRLWVYMPYITDISGNIYTPRSFQHTCNVAYLMYTRYAYMNIGLFECKQGIYKIRIKLLKILLSDWLKRVHRIHHTHGCATYTILF